MKVALETESDPLDADLEKVLPGVYRWHEATNTEMRKLDGAVLGLQEVVNDGLQELADMMDNRTRDSDCRLAIVFANIAAQLLGRPEVHGDSALQLMGLSPQETEGMDSGDDGLIGKDGMLTGTSTITGSPTDVATHVPVRNQNDRAEHANFIMVHKHQSLSDLWDEWYGTGKFADELGGIEGRNKTYGSKWRKHFKDKQLYSRTSRVVQAIKALSKQEHTHELETIANLEEMFKRNNRSVANLVVEFQKQGLLATRKPRGQQKRLENAEEPSQ